MNCESIKIPLITIITPSYNLIKSGRKDFFKQNIESVQSQTYKNIEHIVIDGASTDRTIEVLKDYQNQGLITYYSEPDRGIYDAMNKGILKAKGKYVVCLNSDDFYSDEHAIEWLVEKAESENADACYGDAIRVSPTTLKVLKYWNGKETFKPLYGDFPCHQTFIIKVSVMKELGLYDLKYKVSSDNNFFIKMIQNNKKICGIKKSIITFRDGGFSNYHLELSKKERIQGIFEEYGKYHNLTFYDIKNLFSRRYLDIPLDQAVKLGAKLEKSAWIEDYFNHLINYHMDIAKMSIVSQKNDFQPTKNPQIKRYKLFGFLPLSKIKETSSSKKVYLFNFIPIFKKKYSIKKVKYLVLSIPIFGIRRKINKSKYYLFGLKIFTIKNVGN